MSITLRDMQKCLSNSKRNVDVNFSGTRTMARLARFVGGHNRFREVLIRNGRIINSCSCELCERKGRAVDAQSFVDSLTHKYGPQADLDEVLAELEKQKAEAEQQPKQDAGDKSGDQNGQGEQGENSDDANNSDSDSDEGSDQGESDGQSRAQPTGSASGQSSKTPQNGQPSRAAHDKAQQELQNAKQALEAARAAAQKNPKNRTAVKTLAEAKRSFAKARKKASYDAVAVQSSPSLSARKHLTTSHGRLRRVPQKLRSQMADLINRLVSQAGTTGSQLGPVPVLSARKLVNRMLVKRPLPNALKEDSVSGRPVTLFLPDISPSCEAQAQIACDLANAAGYAGVSGSDVLVFPHCNGMVDAEPNYFPWLNGKPVTTDVTQIKTLFDDVCGGRSRFKVRVAVFLGDHDAVVQYEQIAALKTVLRAVWLHNYQPSSGRPVATPVQAGSPLAPGWSDGVKEKLSLVQGCITTESMLQGMRIALK